MYNRSFFTYILCAIFVSVATSFLGAADADAQSSHAEAQLNEHNHNDNAQEDHNKANAHDDHSGQDKGAHGGKRFVNGVDPHFQAWITHSGKPATKQDAKLLVSLTRLGGSVY